METNQQELYIMIGEIRATNNLILQTLQEHAAERKALSEEVKELNAKVNKAAAVLTLATVFIGAVFNQGLRKLGIIS
jgi:ABC-type transporter Mla maintaining outer membrane lipid asymmetry permease subunit MlaE